ncbi:MAG: NADH-quinone oxidoreductase subunit K, partial [Candidatus Eisenbacteria bacterium]|nr:NADH-quinone oxidoreductase subunit K [Candidatus Eisenbacteria bacterium]
MNLDELLGHYPYLLTFLLLAIGLWGVVVKRNLVKKLVGMTIFQTAIFLFYIQGAAKQGATIPIHEAHHGGGHAAEAAAIIDAHHGAGHAAEAAAIIDAHHGAGHAAEAMAIINPLPHVLILTA